MMTGARHATASVFLFEDLSLGNGERIGLIHHPRLRRWMIPGGHVEANEQTSEAAVREVAEETGFDAVLVHPVASPVPVGSVGVVAARPFWVVEQEVPAETREPRPHIHVDHLFVAVTAVSTGARPAELPFAWFRSGELGDLVMFPETRELASRLLAARGDYTSLVGTE